MAGEKKVGKIEQRWLDYCRAMFADDPEIGPELTEAGRSIFMAGAIATHTLMLEASARGLDCDSFEEALKPAFALRDELNEILATETLKMRETIGTLISQQTRARPGSGADTASGSGFSFHRGRSRRDIV